MMKIIQSDNVDEFNNAVSRLQQMKSCEEIAHVLIVIKRFDNVVDDFVEKKSAHCNPGAPGN